MFTLNRKSKMKSFERKFSIIDGSRVLTRFQIDAKQMMNDFQHCYLKISSKLNLSVHSDRNVKCQNKDF